MDHLLPRDIQYFNENFPGAIAFLDAAYLRYECYNLAMIREEYKDTVVPWQKKRLKELLVSPACQEDWFKKLLEDEFKPETLDDEEVTEK